MWVQQQQKVNPLYLFHAASQHQVSRGSICCVQSRIGAGSDIPKLMAHFMQDLLLAQFL
jgi:hypothetical protein